jgi:drug/metabolite transporter (DMT)-like permease
MNLKVLLLVIASVGIASVAQLVLKVGVSSSRVQAAMFDGGNWLQVTLVTLSNWTVLLGLGMYAVGTVMWLFVLARIDVTLAYPYLGLGIIFTMILGAWFLSEPVGAMRIVGTLLIVSGVVLISRS